jgi:hypothetical protein
MPGLEKTHGILGFKKMQNQMQFQELQGPRPALRPAKERANDIMEGAKHHYLALKK